MGILSFLHLTCVTLSASAMLTLYDYKLTLTLNRCFGIPHRSALAMIPRPTQSGVFRFCERSSASKGDIAAWRGLAFNDRMKWSDASNMLYKILLQPSLRGHSEIPDQE